MTLTKIQKTILFVGIEDVSGLWEIAWEVAWDEYASGDDDFARKIDMLRDNFTILLRDGLIKTYKCQEPLASLDELSTPEVERALALEQNWKEPRENAVSVRFSTTDKGKEFYWKSQ